jgi:hypothetical protein
MLIVMIEVCEGHLSVKKVPRCSSASDLLSGLKSDPQTPTAAPMSNPMSALEKTVSNPRAFMTPLLMCDPKCNHPS